MAAVGGAREGLRGGEPQAETAGHADEVGARSRGMVAARYKRDGGLRR